MSVKKVLNQQAGGRSEDRFKCNIEMQLSRETGRSLKDLDPEMVKSEIKKWAKAVVAYARTLSGKLIFRE